MNINPTVGAQPSFQAKLKENDTLKKFVDNMGKGQYADFQKTLGKMENVSKGDTLELYEKAEPKKNPKDNQWVDFYIRNPKKEGSDVKIHGGYQYGNMALPDKLMKVLKNVVTPKTNETEMLLTEPATKDQRSFGEKLSDFFSSDQGDSDPTAYRWA